MNIHMIIKGKYVRYVYSKPYSALDFAMTFCDQVCWIAEHEVSFKGKTQFESVRGDGYQQWKAES